MIILSLHFGWHDLAAVVSNDYEILAAVQGERLTRVKGDGRLDCIPQTIAEALRIAGKDVSEVDILCSGRGLYKARYFRWQWHKKLKYELLRHVNRKWDKSLASRYIKVNTLDYRRVFKADAFMADLGLKAECRFFDYNHHLAHALSALFFTDWSDALLYTADGGGDWVHYSMRHFGSGGLQTLYGGDEEFTTPIPTDSVGLAYGYMTQALGYKANRHEGKLTGLSAFGSPVLYDDLMKHFRISDDGRIRSNFANNRAMRSAIFALSEKADAKDAAASVQKLLEDLILKSISIYRQRTGANHIGLAGGVFANVALNRRIAELPGIKEVFIFPGMGDEGIAVGGVYQFLLQRDGLKTWEKKRRRLEKIYWGGVFDDDVAQIFAAPDIARISTDTAETAAQLLSQGRIVALYCNRMEFGPRALGARSILANPADAAVNDTLNRRLTRTEFMPFAPYVLAEDADDVFVVNDTNRYAMRFMTITCEVREKWRDKIPAVVHTDGTARPQIIRDADNPLYADILRKFKAKTGLPVLINTSFNAHEEPIIYTPQECLKALRDRRVDYVATPAGVYQLKDNNL